MRSDVNDELKNGTTGTYQGSITDLHGPIRVLGHHVSLSGDGSTRYILTTLNEKGEPIQTLSNVRRDSITDTTASTR